MPLHLHDTLSATRIALPQRTPGETSIYLCGPTVYNLFHVGNARPLVVFDVVARHLRARGYRVTFVRNVTDVDDKIIAVLEADRLNISRVTVERPDGTQESKALPLSAYLLLVAATNFKQRLRTTLEYFHADRLNFAVCGTPNRLEYDQGFFVKGGDGLADVKPIAHLYKSQVYAMARHLGVPAAERAQYMRFQELIQQLRQQRDGSGRRPFALPLALSSRDPQRLALDRSNLRDWLLAQGYTAPGLHWLADYACRDDYGTGAARTSAWAGLHYFACRDGEGQVLTAPEGNAWLARGLARAAAGRMLPQALVFRVELGRQDAAIDVYLATEQRSIRLLVREGK